MNNVQLSLWVVALQCPDRLYLELRVFNDKSRLDAGKKSLRNIPAFLTFEYMTAVFEDYLRSQGRLSEADILRISSLAMPRKLRRNEPLLTAGKICRHKTFITRGLLRTYSVSEDGSEPILQFSPELTWTLDAESYDQQQPSRYHIAAVEPSEVLLWQKSDFEILLAEIPGLKKYAEQLISRNIYSGRQRLLSALSASPEEKYEDFVRNSPGLLSRLPLRMIAAYLGISLKTLTRIRHAQWAR